MAAALPATNMKLEDVIPDVSNPTHDPRFWCLPPVNDKPAPGRSESKMYLVTQGRKVGVWYNWTVVKAMVDGHSSGAQRAHTSMAACVAKWQEHCALGVHPHPPAPAQLLNLSTLSLATSDEEGSPISSSISSLTSITADTISAEARYFAIWGGRVVFTDRLEAKTAFLRVEAAGQKPKIRSTGLYDEAKVFSQSVYWV
ncbi:hypothetical protein K438DRAFT_1956291 [Mycena galopus ATCC 62051]|nr:hypothetical protein K438DRAFT_1975716 [Mycena galopus ATCC 62051]KAF8214204.1 hypothetical protein K438DRAFT_1956291 [Mycena galopus ATCC 62051]